MVRILLDKFLQLGFRRSLGQFVSRPLGIGCERLGVFFCVPRELAIEFSQRPDGTRASASLIAKPIGQIDQHLFQRIETEPINQELHDK